MIDHHELESLLGVYVLDAVSPDESAQIEQHLDSCQRCKAEVVAHREVVALLSGGGAEAPLGLWDKIAADISGSSDLESFARVTPLEFTAKMRSGKARSRRIRLGLVAGLAAAAVLALLAAVSAQLSHLDSEVHQYQAIAQKGGIAPAVASLLLGQHRIVTLASPSGRTTGTMAIAPDGEAYWVRSNLRRLPSGRTYQLWALAGSRIVSIGLIGSDPNQYSAFRLAKNVKELMVTAEPEGGTVIPTTPVLLKGASEL